MGRNASNHFLRTDFQRETVNHHLFESKVFFPYPPAVNADERRRPR
jgi:hypothetical protein